MFELYLFAFLMVSLPLACLIGTIVVDSIEDEEEQ